MGRKTTTRGAWALALLAATSCLGLACSSDSVEPATSPESSPSTPPSEPACDPARPAEAGTTEQTYDQNGAVRTYELTIPEDYDGTDAAPLVVLLHGAGGTAESVSEESSMPAEGAARDFVVVAPEALAADVAVGSFGRIEGGIWNIAAAFTDPATGSTTTVPDAEITSNDDVAFINGLVDHLESTLCIDADREYVTGKSNGAGMAAMLACEPTVRFAAIAPVAGINMTKFCAGSAVPPTITLHGDADEHMPYLGGTIMDIELGVPTVPDRVAELAAKQGCTDPTVSDVADDVQLETWTCPEGAAMELYTVLGGGHTWPGQDPDRKPELGRMTDSIDATALILDFFDEHPGD